MTAASRAKRLDPRLDVAILERSAFISYSTCGIPYLLSDDVSAQDLVRFTPGTLRAERGIEAHANVQVDEVMPSRRRVLGHRTDTRESVEFPFDRLLLATGVQPAPSNIPGASLENVFSINTLADALRVRPALETADRVGIVGGGYVGLEMSEALRKRGRSVTIFESSRHVLPSIDGDMARIVEYELLRHGVGLRTASHVDALIGEDERVTGIKTGGALGVSPVDAVMLDTGVLPNVGLADAAGIRRGETGGIAVNEYMETSVPSIFAAGNCAEAFCLLRRRPILHHIGTVAAKQGRVAGDNLAGGRSTFHGTVGTTILKVFDLAVGRVGLSSDEAASEQIKAVSVRIEALDRASYFPESRKLWIKLIANKENGKIIGAQCAGYGEVSKRIDVAATGIMASMTVGELAQLDLSYTPPYGSLWDPLLVAAQALLRKL